MSRKSPILQALLSRDREVAASRWLLCVSGGADSMALLHACHRAALRPSVAHVNFQLRGEESDADEAFVREVCERVAFPLHVQSFDTKAYAAKKGISIEMAARELRYDFFRTLMRTHKLSRIVVAHNADDDTETMLLNLLRGTGLEGLTGMADDSGEILRPLLGFTHAQLKDFLVAIGEKWREDSTNAIADVKRNFLRLEVLPLLRTRWPGLDKTLARTRAHLSESQAAVDVAISKYLPSDAHFLTSENLRECPAPGELLHRWLQGKGASPRQISEMQEAATGARWLLPDGTVEKTRAGLRLHTGYSEITLPNLKVEYIRATPEILAEMKAEKENKTLYADSRAKLHVRIVRPDDRISPLGLKGSCPVRKILKDAGIPASQRDKFALVADEKERVVWLPGLKRSSLYLVPSEAEDLLKITIE